MVSDGESNKFVNPFSSPSLPPSAAMDVSSVSALASDSSTSSTVQSSDALGDLLRRANMGPTPPPPNPTVSPTQIQTVNIRAHVHIILDLENTSYSQWRRLFNTAFGKFGLWYHISSTATPASVILSGP